MMSWLHSSLVALDLPRKDQCLDMISLKLGLALLYVVINIRGAVVSFLPVVSSSSDSLLTLLVFCQASRITSWGYSLQMKYQYRLICDCIRKCDSEWIHEELELHKAPEAESSQNSLKKQSFAKHFEALALHKAPRSTGASQSCLKHWGLAKPPEVGALFGLKQSPRFTWPIIFGHFKRRMII